MDSITKIVHDLLSEMKNPPTDEVMVVTYAIVNMLRAYSDGGVVDTGYGFGENCLDFWLDDKAIRVIIKTVPALDR